MQSGHIKTKVKGHYTVTINTETNYVTLTPRNAEHKFTLIWLHGLGDTAHGFTSTFTDARIGMVPPTCKVVLPTAPIREVTCNGGVEMTSWFDIFSTDEPSTLTVNEARELVSQEEIRDSVRIVTDIVHAEV